MSLPVATRIPYSEEKTKNAICFFASEHERRTGTLLTHTSLHKYLAFLDYSSTEKTGRPALGVLYQTRERQPLPVSTYAKLQRSRRDCVAFLRGGRGGYFVKAIGEPDLSSFSPFEVSEMKSLVETYAHRFAKRHDAGDASFKEEGSPERTWFARTNASVGYEEVFDNIIATYKEAYAMADLHALIEKYVAQIKELETRLAETKRRLEVVMEASRLLVEAGLSDEQADVSSKEKIW